MPNITTIPAPRVPFIDARTNDISREWFLFLLNLFTRANSGDVDIETLKLAPATSDTQTVSNESINVAPLPQQQLVDLSLFATAPSTQYHNTVSYDYVYAGTVQATKVTTATLDVSGVSTFTGNLLVKTATSNTYAKVAIGAANGNINWSDGTNNYDASIKRSAFAEVTVSNDLVVFNKFGCNTKAAQGSYGVGGAATDLASVITLCNNIRTALINNGICS